MIPWVHLDTAKIPDSEDELRLMRRGEEYSIMSGSIELMNSRMSGSEKALASLACERIAGRPKPAMLIGGLGMGFTLRAALAELPDTAQVDVAELVPAVVAWGRGPMAHIFGDSLTDPRVAIHEVDVAALIGAADGGYDAILLDVDNGPGGLSRDANDGLYSVPGLRACAKALRPGGLLAVWSSGPNNEFARRLRTTGYAVEEVRVHANRKGRGARHVIWIGTKS
ncbi:MAG: spermidine synthase [Pseudomonadota bacterium]|mgnify:CR=1 FL=1|uniref:spermidine synthase n=1 Tax=unclassified Phenylobacterium TaxID=2640670 RepID=UPI0006F69871|nr:MULTISPECIES: spermidine synthase [unclassified Phenylobacterium]KRB42516.1 spermidine synthase [Phenylobacterium sp. Root700]MBT9471633.1 spermidine synthase [Phenylobacterium sp.]